MFHGIAKRGGVFKVDDDVASPNAKCKGGGLFKICDEPEPPSEGGVFKTYMFEPESPIEGACCIAK